MSAQDAGLVLRLMHVRSGGRDYFLDEALAFAMAIAAGELPRPRQIIFSSAGELSVLGQPSVVAFMSKVIALFPPASVTIATQACLGLHASLLEADTGPLGGCLIFLVESPQATSQAVLDAAGIGADQGLRAAEGVACLYLEKVEKALLKPSDVVFLGCEILAQGPGIAGFGSLIKETLRYIDKAQTVAPGRVTRFDTQSPWSKELRRGFDLWTRTTTVSGTWLESVETDSRHYLTLKPLLEIQRYASHLAHGSIIVTTLGAGGRLGVLQLGRFECAIADFNLARPLRFSGDYTGDLNLVQEAVKGGDLRPMIFYLRRDQRGIANGIFTWRLGNVRATETA